MSEVVDANGAELNDGDIVEFGYKSIGTVEGYNVATKSVKLKALTTVYLSPSSVKKVASASWYDKLKRRIKNAITN